MDSILNSVKKVLNIDEGYTAFDVDITLHVNSTFSTLNQLGVGPEEGFEIQDASAVWADFTGGDKKLNLVKSYVPLRVRMLFDPPENSFTQEAFKKQIDEFEWRLKSYSESVVEA